MNAPVSINALSGFNDLSSGNDLVIFGVIGGDSGLADNVRSLDVLGTLGKLRTPRINIRLHSPGGSVQEALSIVGVLKADGRPVTVRIDGMCGSAATLIACSTDEVIAASDATYFVHDPYSAIQGGATDLRKMADEIDRLRGVILDAYIKKTKRPRGELSDLMQNETYLSAQQALELGFVDKIDGAMKIAACAPLSKETLTRLLFSNGAGGAETMSTVEIGAPAAPSILDPIKAERDRTTKIVAAVRNANLDVTFAEKLIADGISGQAVNDAIVNEVSRRAHDGGNILNIVSDSARTFDNPTFLNKTISDALYCRMTGKTPEGPAREWAGRTMLEMGAACIEARGGKVSYRSKTALADSVMNAAYHTRSDFPELLTASGNRVLMEAFEASQSPLKSIARERVTTDYRTISTLRLGNVGKLEEVNEHGEITATTRSEMKESFAVKTYAKIFALTRQAIVNDDLTAFGDMASAWGRSAAETEADIMVGLLTANANKGATCDDGFAMFATQHSNLSATGAALDVTTLSAGRLALRAQKDLDGSTLISVTPAYLLVGPALETAAEQVLASINATTVADVNPFAQRMRLLVEPRMTGNRWYLVADPATLGLLQYAYLAGARGPQMSTQEGWNVLGMEYRAVLDFGAGPGDWRAGYLNTGA